jgi:hypothetical protein
MHAKMKYSKKSCEIILKVNLLIGFDEIVGTGTGFASNKNYLFISIHSYYSSSSKCIPVI